MTYYYGNMGIIFLFTSIGALLWGYKIDYSADIWQFRIVILLFEIFSTLSLLVLLLSKITFSPIMLLLFISLLEFLFAYEIPWSRVAWHELNDWTEQQGGKHVNVSLYIVIATSLISALGPGFGALLGMTQGIETIVTIKLFSLLPYFYLCYLMMRMQIKRTTAQKTQSPVGLRSVFQQNYYKVFAITVIFAIFANAFLMVSLPVVVMESLGNKGYGLVTLFYVLSALIPILCTTLLSKTRVDHRIQRYSVSIFIAMFIFGILFFQLPLFYAKAFFYLLYNMAIIYFNILITKAIYQKGLEMQQGRLFSLFQITMNFSFPIAAITVSIAPDSTQHFLPAMGFSLFLLIAIAVYLIIQMNKVPAPIHDWRR
ncbi:MFS transporter [Xenorhabdus kozodoii]|nr:MFS transporter [Xenorhabdus kozodoii]